MIDVGLDQLEVRHIPYPTLVEYWREVDHFQDPNKVYTEVLGSLGPYKSTYRDPRRFSYGLFFKDAMIGATHVTEWNADWIRFRTINIRSGFRGKDLGWHLLQTALQKDWAGYPWLFGWFRRSAHDWAMAHGFHEIDGVWHGQHIGVLRHLESGTNADSHS